MSPRKNRLRQDDDDLAANMWHGAGNGMLHLTEGLIPKFTGQDKTYPAARWVQDVEDSTELCGWTPLQQLLMARRSLAGTALLWFRAERIYKTWDEFKAAVLKEFPDNIDTKTIHELMSSRCKKPSESCLEYMFTMKELGKRGKMPDYVAIKYIVEGIKDQEVNKIMLYGVSTYSELKEKIKIYEQLKENMSGSSKEKEAKSRHVDHEKSNRRLAFTRCFSCGEMSHSSAECPHKDKGLKCFWCNSFGHISSQCKTPPATTSRGKDDGNAAASSSEVGNTKKLHSSNAGGAASGGKKSFMCHANVTNFTSDGGNDVSCADTRTAMTNNNYQCLTTVMTTARPNMINNKPLKQISVCGKNEIALIDSGSDVNLLTIECYSELSARELVECDPDDNITGLGGGVKCYGQVKLKLLIDGYWYNDMKFFVISKDNIPVHLFRMIIGQELLKHCTTVLEDGFVLIIPRIRWVYTIRVDDPSVIGNEVSPAIREKVNNMVQSYVPRKTKEAPIKLRIVLKDDIPVAQRPRRLAPREQQEVDQQVAKWLEDGIVQKMKTTL
ncbi:uncharacterized protein LOC134742167 [Cydia strobilella]|uniref:uncharacterized protein LOC134742167 n=1 Tax=Cydia strobilella TaxID=1100964 RepID=UPI003003FED3